MTNRADNPYAAPQSPGQTPVPSAVLLRTVVVAAVAFVVSFTLTAAFAVIAFVVVNDVYGPPIEERLELARLGILACCTVLGLYVGAVVDRREFRRQTKTTESTP